jgi:hypothetical protein
MALPTGQDDEGHFGAARFAACRPHLDAPIKSVEFVPLLMAHPRKDVPDWDYWPHLE